MSVARIGNQPRDWEQIWQKKQTKSFLNLFSLCIDVPQNIISFSRVNKLWYQMAVQSRLWEKLCYQAGIEIPYDSRSYDAFRYEKGAIFLKQARVCSEPKIEVSPLRIEIDPANSSVHFVEARYITVQQEKQVIVYDCDKQNVVNLISTQQKIVGLCTNLQEVFLSLKNRQIVAYPLLETERTPLFTFDGHNDEQVTENQDDSILSLANDQWLLSLSLMSQTLKQWNIENQECVAVLKLDSFFDFQIHQNRLFLRTSMPNDRNKNPLKLWMTDLNQRKLEFGQPRIVPNSKLSTEAYSISYIREVCTELDQSGDEETTECMGYEMWLQTTTFNPNESVSKLIDVRKSNDFSFFTTQNGLAITVHEVEEKDRRFDRIELFDSITGSILHRIQKHKMMAFSNHCALTVFQGTIRYLTNNNQVVKITFPSSESEQHSKRRLETFSDPIATKKAKTA